MAAPNCTVCSALPQADLIDFNLTLADPNNWPREVFAEWKPPKGTLPAKMRSWGGVRLGQQLLSERGIEVSRGTMQKHFIAHVPHIALNVAQTEEIAKMFLGRGSNLPAVVPPATPRMFLDYYSQGVRLGVYALQELERRINAATDAGEKIPDATLWKLADLGAKLSANQLSALTRGKQVEEDDSGDGFRAGSAPLPSQAFGGHRVRVIEGESRPVVDRGPADRKHFNERQAQEGGARISGR